MAEVATGAVNTLLGVIGNEAHRLRRVRGDVQFIQEEMESMKSFLVHLARTHGEEQDEQVRTWMNQVRILANDCNNCLDVYLYRRNRDIHRARRGSILHYGGWALWWWLRDLLTQHRAASQLRELKDRARDVGERRLRYGVKLSSAAGKPRPSSPRAGPGPGLTAAPPRLATEEDEDDDDGDDAPGGVALAAMMATPTATPVADADASTTLDGYFKRRLATWITAAVAGSPPPAPNPIPTIAFVLAKANAEDAASSRALALEALGEVKRVFSRSILVDVEAVHLDSLPLRPKEILYYILREIQIQIQMEHNLAKSQFHQGRLQPQGSDTDDPWGIYCSKKTLLHGIKHNIVQGIMKVDDKFQELKGRVIHGLIMLPDLKIIKVDEKELKDEIAKQPLDVLLRLLIRPTSEAAEQDQTRKKAMRKLSALNPHIIQRTAEKLKELIEVEASSEQQQVPQQFQLSSAVYERILKEEFPTTTTTTTTTSSTSTLVEDQIKEIIHSVKEMIHELQEYNKPDKTTGEPPFKEAEATRKIDRIQHKIKEHLKIKGIVDKIQNHLEADERILVILKTDHKYVSIWEETRNILNLLETSRCFAGAAIATTANIKSTREAQEHFFYPQLELIEYSLVGLYIDTVLQNISSQPMHEENIWIVRNILEECGPHEFCMKVFADALKAKPRRSTEELRKLHTILQAAPKSLPSTATKMLKFSYNDLPKQHRSCLLYLAIFPAGQKMRRSNLIRRWVAEGLITTEDWRWSSSVAEAEKCFDALIDRQLVCRVDIGATGRVKTCMVDHLVHGFIIKIAMKQRIVETRLSLHLAHHFSIFNDVRLRSSDTIETFLVKKVPDLLQVSKLKVLDLEGCRCFAKNKRHLKDICSNILMLKYLSLRGTDVTKLPREVNNLQVLEVLDIRHTNIPVSATRNVLLLKLKCLLAGHTDPYPSSTDTGVAEDFSSVQIPEMIEKMLDVEVLSNVKPQKHCDFTYIGSLYQLKKLGVVINKDGHLQSFLQGISDLHHCIRSLSITLNIPRHEGTHPGTDPLELQNAPKVLESLSIGGSTQKGELLPLLVTKDSHKLAKVTLSRTSLKQDDLEVLAKLPKLQCVRLWHMSYTDTQLTFKKNEFPQLNLLIVDSSGTTTKISFPSESPELEKIVIDQHGVAVRHLRTFQD